MTDFIRVRDKQTGHEYTIPSLRFDDEAHTILDKPAVDRHGDARGITYRRDLGESAPAPRRATRTAPKAPTKPVPVSTPEPDPNGQTADSEEGAS